MEAFLERAHARSLAYLFFARALVHPERQEWLPELVQSSLAVAQVLAAAGLEVTAKRLEALQRSFLTAEARGTLREECLRLCGTLRGAGCSAYETEFSNEHVFQRAQQMADIAGFYRAFGLEPSGEGERVDHIAAELEFMHFLACKELHATREEASRQELCREAQRKFLAEHLGRWMGIFAQLVARTTTEKFYVELTQLLDEFVTADARALGACPERITAPTSRRGEDEDEERASCGACHDFVEISRLGGKP